jgi:hypothetical protein
MSKKIDDDYIATMRIAIREYSAIVAQRHGKPSVATAIFDHEGQLADHIVDRMGKHYTHTRARRAQRKVNA